MWYYKTVLAAIEDAINALQPKGVSEGIIQFVHSLPDNQKGKAIGALNQNPSMMIDDLKKLFESGYKPSHIELDYVDDYDPRFQSWALYQYKLLRSKPVYTVEDNLWEYEIPPRDIKNNLDEIYDFFRAHILDNPNYNLGSQTLEKAYEDSFEWHNAMVQRGSGKFYLPFERDKSGNLVDEKIVHRFEDGSMIVRVEDSNDLDVEGNFMHHCVGSYARSVESGNCTIYSLRNKFNNPEATIEVGKDGAVKQIKGPSNSGIHDDDLVSKISDFFSGRDDIKKTSGYSYNHLQAEDWHPDAVKWQNGPVKIKYGIDEFAYGPHFEDVNDEDESGDFLRFGIAAKSWKNEDQEAFKKQNLEALDIDELVEKTVSEIKDGVKEKSYTGTEYLLEDYDFKELSETIVDIAYNKLDLMIDSTSNMADEYIARRDGYLTADDIERYKKSKIQQIIVNNPLLDLLSNFSRKYDEWEEEARNQYSEGYEQFQDSDKYGEKVIDLMNNSADKLSFEIAKRIYETYPNNPVVKKLNVFGVKFTIPWENFEFSNKINLRTSKVLKDDSRSRTQMRNITTAYKDTNQLKFQNISKDKSFNLTRHRTKQK